MGPYRNTFSVTTRAEDRRNSARTRATSSFGLNGLVT